MLLGNRLTPMVKNLLLANVIVFFLVELIRFPVSFYLGMVPSYFWHGYIWQTVTYMFLHGGFGHLFWNMFALWMFGTALEYEWGSKEFLKYYMITGIGAGILSAIVDPFSNVPIVGASGAIYGLLLGFGMLYPNQQILVYFLFPVRAKYFVMIFGGIELIMALSQPNSTIAHVAHLGGILIGWLYLKKELWLRKMLSSFKSSRKSSDYKKEEYSRSKMHIVFDKEKEMDLLRKEVDELLDKVNREGLGKLTPSEIKRLKDASRKLRDWDKN